MVLVFMARGRGRSRKSGTFDNFSRNMQRPVMKAGGNDISLLQVLLISIILYFLLRFLLPLIWVLALIVALVVLIKVVLKML